MTGKYQFHTDANGATTLSVADNDLRQELYDVDLFDAPLFWEDEDEEGNPKPVGRERKKRIDRLTTGMSLLPFMEKLSNEEFAGDLEPQLAAGSDDLRAFVAALRVEISKASDACRKTRATDGVPFDWLAFAYRPGERVTVSLDDVEHGAEVTGVSIERSFFGASATVAYKFLVHDGKSFRWGRATKNIPAYAGRKTDASLGVRGLTPEDEAVFERRGMAWMDIVKAPSYCSYSGVMSRKSWWQTARFRAAGRMMSDLVGMRTMDPNYKMYYGETDDNDDSFSFDRDCGSAAALASPYVYGFSFFAKAWGEFVVDGVGAIEFRADAFDKLVMDESRKRLVSALVSNSAGGFDDIIDGKGGGCVFLLHGPPGCGKTLTAEAIAERLGRPLYMVGAGELGVSPDELESRLKGILDLAHSWNAVLLIDECDIFLERRASADVSRNAMVGIFLRLLEYYQGILFLTTNRVGDLDDAFLSRVSVGLHYKALGARERESVWRNLSSSAKIALDEGEIRELSQRDINGRQIKHAIRLALALAAEKGVPAGFDDISEVVSISEQFKKDFAEAKTKAEIRPGDLEG